MFNAYQSIQRPQVETSLKKRAYLASFIGQAPARALFVGLYEIRGHRLVDQAEYYSMTPNQTLRGLGALGPDRDAFLWFDLHPTGLMQDLKGRLVVAWPPPERSWSRLAERNVFTVFAIHEESALARKVPDPHTLSLTWQELQVLPVSWRAAFAEWRGVYFIYDRNDGKGYVGSAYGRQNLLGRWLNYASSGHGGNRLLRSRDPQNFLFTILQRVSPDMPDDEVVAIEQSWKIRLHTLTPNGLNNN